MGSLCHCRFHHIFGVSCEKQNLDTPEKNIEYDIQKDEYSDYTVKTVNYIDNELTTTNVVEFSENFKSSNGDLFIVEKQSIDNENKTFIIEHLGFTTEQKYIDYGIENNYPLKEEIEFSKQMREYIETNNVEEYFDQYGEFPKEYKEYEEYLYTSIFSEKDKSIPSLLIGLLLSKEKYGVGGHWVAFVKTWPVMLPGWNNEVSSYQPIGLAGVVSFYNKTFYRDRMFTRVQWACTWYNMPNWADDAVSSWIRL